MSDHPLCALLGGAPAFAELFPLARPRVLQVEQITTDLLLRPQGGTDVVNASFGSTGNRTAIL